MFEKVGEGPNDITTFFRNGAVYEKLSEPNWIKIQGIGMSFYRLKCNGATGYVNVKWVDD